AQRQPVQAAGGALVEGLQGRRIPAREAVEQRDEFVVGSGASRHRVIVGEVATSLQYVSDAFVDSRQPWVAAAQCPIFSGEEGFPWTSSRHWPPSRAWSRPAAFAAPRCSRGSHRRR